jgi:putative ABC transport system substrate-binding protein
MGAARLRISERQFSVQKRDILLIPDVVLGAGEAMRRREFIAFIGSTAVAWPLEARAQQPAPTVGFLSPGSSKSDTGRMRAILRGLAESGYVEGQNVLIAYRGAEGQLDQLPALAADLVDRQVAVIITAATQATLAAKAATTTIPIIFTVGVDPAEFGIVASLNRPSSNLTGVSALNVTVMGKRLELLHELVPRADVIALLANVNSVITEVETKAVREAARALGVELRVLGVSNEGEIDTAFVTLAKEQPLPLVISADPMFTNHMVQLVVLAARYVVPTIYSNRDFTAAGGLMSYGSDLPDTYRQVGVYAGRILKGAKPTELPVQQAVKVELVLNVKTAKTLGLTFPEALLSRADEVIE